MLFLAVESRPCCKRIHFTLPHIHTGRKSGMIVTAMKRKDGQFHQIVNCSLSSRNNYRYQAICLLIFLPSRALFMYDVA